MTHIINYRPDGPMRDGLLAWIDAIDPDYRGTLVQVGAWRGDATLLFAPAFAQVLDIDPWQGDTGKACTFEDVYAHYCCATERLRNVDHMRKSSLSAALDFEPESVDAVYIDGSHMYGNVKADIEAWWPKVALSGYIGGHDYDMPGVQQAVDETFGTPNQTFADNSWLVRKGEAWTNAR